VLVTEKTHDNGQLILKLEQNILRWLRDELNIPPYLDKEEMPRGGSSETLPFDEPSEHALLEQINTEFDRLVEEFS